MNDAPEPDRAQIGEGMMALIQRLFPICRSITGPGVVETLSIMAEQVPLEVVRTPSGTRVFDWTVPNEWHIREAFVEDPNGTRLVDFAESNLHVLNYSTPIDRVVTHDELMAHLFTDPDRPGAIPYRTSYYERNWGFCVRHDALSRFDAQQYRVRIDAEHVRGNLCYGELLIPGEQPDEVIIFSHICHPSLANDNLSGIAVTVFLAQQLAAMRLRYSYRFVWAPGTIGSISWLANNQSNLHRIAHGLVCVLLGDRAELTYKKSRDGVSELDAVCAYLQQAARLRVIDFEPYGYDERQFASPGVNLPVGRLSRSVNGGYPEYHSSDDNLDIISGDALVGSFDCCLEILRILEHNRVYRNLAPMGEPQLGRRGLYRARGGASSLPGRESAMLWLLNQANGERTLLDVAERSGVDFNTLAAVATELVQASLLEAVA